MVKAENTQVNRKRASGRDITQRVESSQSGATAIEPEYSIASFARDSFRRWGYLQATLDTFNRIPPTSHRDLDQLPESVAAPWREIYCRSIGAEFMHIPDSAHTDWIAEQMERTHDTISTEFILQRLVAAEMFERFLHTRYVGAKRFSLEGIGVLIPALDQIIDVLATKGVELVMIGMAHRGRLTTMHLIAGSKASNIFSCFEDVDPRSVLGSGDVKYHKGATGDYKTFSGKTIKVHIASNPSHLEAVNPVIMGRTKAKQIRSGADGKKKVVAIILHGDAAFAGQGIAAEALNFAHLAGFGIGGTIHVVINNLIGFTAPPESLHSSRFATDIAKRLPIPIFHVNAEDPQAAMQAARIAAEYRSTYNNDVVLDLIGYRRFGHNEVDDPTTTSPVLYDRLKSHPSIHEIFARSIGVDSGDLKKLEDAIIESLKAEQNLAKTMTSQPMFSKFPGYWDPFFGGPYRIEYEVATTVLPAVCDQVAAAYRSFPAGFSVHPKIEKLNEQRIEMLTDHKPLDYGAAEALAFGSLLLEGIPVRLVGQDSRRGTFSHRQAVAVDIKNGTEYYPLKNISPTQAPFEVYDSQLSEAAAVGFEYGFSRDFPETLVLWEAQFGDFVNGAQIIIDQFLCAGEDKWGLLSGLVLLLPHGFEGNGPEHSSGRIERFLELAAEDNIQVSQPSTAAQYFHLLRRQAKRHWRKPLIVFTPKSMLRSPAAMSSRKRFEHEIFKPVLGDTEFFPEAEKVLVCSGKIAHEIRAERAKIGAEHCAVITVEQFYPFPEMELRAELRRYERAQQVVWVQEEPANMGGLNFIRPKLDRMCAEQVVSSVKRSASASPATGSPKAHEMEQRAILKLALAKVV